MKDSKMKGNLKAEKKMDKAMMKMDKNGKMKKDDKNDSKMKGNLGAEKRMDKRMKKKDCK